MCVALTCPGLHVTQDVGGLARALCAVLIDDQVRTHLQQAARLTALRFTPSAIVDRSDPLQARVKALNLGRA